MFTKLKPQVVQHQSGYIVQVGGRTSVEYRDGDVHVEIKSDMLDKVVPIYEKSLKVIKKINNKVLNDDEKKEIINRILMGLSAMGVSAEVVSE